MGPVAGAQAPIAAPAGAAVAQAEHGADTVLQDPLLKNPSFAEQQNRWLAGFKAGAVHMRQTTLLYVLRLALFKRARRYDAELRGQHSGRDVAARRRTPQQPVAAMTRAFDPDQVPAALQAAKAEIARVQQLAQAAIGAVHAALVG